MTGATRAQRALPWLLRALWVAVLVAGGAAIEDATDGRSGAVAATASWGAAVLWLVGVGAVAVPSVATLAAARVVVPLGIVAGGATWWGGAGAGEAATFVVTAIAAVVVVGSAELGRTFAQASAYGAEDRHLLRPPPGYALAAAVAWCLSAAAVVAGPLLIAAGTWLVGVPVAVLGVGILVWSWPRWHQLARRWFVLVPAGIVVHDPLLLAETLMLRRQQVASLHLAPHGTGAADLTGPAGGHAIEIATAETVTAVLSGGRSEPRPIHLTACLVAPSRPGRALGAAAERRFPVG